MKPLAALLLLACVPTAAAQRPEITDFTSNGTLTWANPETNVYCGVDWTVDLAWNWIPFDRHALWNLQPTGHLQTVALPFDILKSVDWNIFTELQERWDSHHYFRIRSAATSLPRPSIEHFITVVNASTGVLDDVVVGTVASSATTVVTNIPVMPAVSALSRIPVSIPFVHSWEVSMSLGDLPSDGWFVSYTHDAVARKFGFPMLEFGPDDRVVVFTVSNRSFSVSWDWLHCRGTKVY